MIQITDLAESANGSHILMESRPPSTHGQRRQFETMDRATLEAYQLGRLNQLIDQILPDNEFYADKLREVSLPLTSLQQLQQIPITRKPELVPDQPGLPAAHHTYPSSEYVRFHRTSGTHGHPLVILDTAADWQWWVDAWQFVLDAANVTRQDIAFMAFSFGPFIGFWSANDALVSRGSLVIPGGSLSSAARMRLILEQRATVLCCTPSYALHLASIADSEQLDLTSSAVRVVIVAGEPGGSVPAVVARIQQAWGAQVVDHAGATEIGPWGYATADRAGLWINESEFVAEFLRTDSDAPSDFGQPSELVLTNLGRYGAPLIRYRTGDLVVPTRPVTDPIACPNNFTRLDGGVLGRVDDMMIVRGVNVYPSAIEQILREVDSVDEFRITVRKEGEMDALVIDIEDQLDAPQRIQDLLKLRLGLHTQVNAVPLGSLPRFELKGKRFVDERRRTGEA